MVSKRLLTDYKKEVEKYLSEYLAEKESEYANISELTDLVNHDITNFTLRGGKRLRAALLYYSYKLFGGRSTKDIIRLSSYVELIQSSLLMHDDIFDNSDIRRGHDSIHKVYAKYAKSQKYPIHKHFGNVIGILAGDIACQMAYEVITTSNFDDDKKVKLIQLAANKTTDVLYGQILDFVLPYQKKYSEDDILKIDIYKTATYTYEMPIMSGAILAGITNGELKYLRDYAINAGIAFQIRDDVLGLFGDEEKLGKPATSDVKEGKRTLLILKTMQNGTPSQRQVLKRYLGRKDLTLEQFEEVRKVVKDTGSLDYSKAKSEEYVKKAQDALLKIDRQNQEEWVFLYDIVEYMIVRNI
jgi:geranylgeranyl diphosphate synthase type I